MQNNRRKFILGSGLIAGGAALGGLSLMAGETAPACAEREVASVISTYGASVKVTRNGEATEHHVKMRGIDGFVKTFNAERGLPFEKIQVSDGNTMKFSHGGTEFTIVNVV